MNVYTFDFICESQDFDHEEEFLLKEDAEFEMAHRQKQIKELTAKCDRYEKALKSISKESVCMYDNYLAYNLITEAKQALAKIGGEV